jgi:alanine dehydrogenase
MELHQTGVVGTSLKKDEQRVPIHPDHFEAIPSELRARLIFEEGYGAPFGIDDAHIASLMGGVAARERILAECDVTIMCKPLPADLLQMKSGSTLWGWAHCVQQQDMAQAAIDRGLSLITWEGMNQWADDGSWRSHIFFRNNEIAGYAGAIHALGLRGIDGEYGPQRKAAVINYGSVGQGAVKGLRALGFTDITLFVLQDPAALAQVPADVEIVRLNPQLDGSVLVDDKPFIDLLGGMDVIMNCVLQDPEKPMHYLTEAETGRLKPGTLIIDISCDEGMGFPFARPTSFQEPMFRVGDLHYYAVDHTPSFLWDSASWENSNALLPYLHTVMSGAQAWQQDETVHRAVEVQDGRIINPQILAFQKRSSQFPYPVEG